jgi:hypothetical protein
MRDQVKDGICKAQSYAVGVNISQLGPEALVGAVQYDEAYPSFAFQMWLMLPRTPH